MMNFNFLKIKTKGTVIILVFFLIVTISLSVLLMFFLNKNKIVEAQIQDNFIRVCVDPPTPDISEPTSPLFKWDTFGNGQTNFQFQIDDNSNFSSPEINISGGAEHSWQASPGNLPLARTYWYRVNVSDNGVRWTGWTGCNSFYLPGPSCVGPSDINANPLVCTIPCGSSICNSTISWNSTCDDALVMVRRSSDPVGSGNVFSSNENSPGQDAPWIDATGYNFDLINDVNSTLVDTVFVKGTPTCPKGWHDASDCNSSRGWACDPDNYNQALDIHFYRDGPAGGGGVFIGSVSANQPREAAVGAECGGNSNHGFVFPTPDSLKDGLSHSIYAYVINIGSGTSNPLLSGSPKTITCCKILNFQGGSSSISPSTVNPGGSYTISCDYGQAGIDCINVTPPSGSCSQSGWSGTAAIFSCTAGSSGGTFTGYCKTVTDTGSNCCAFTNPVGTLTVNSPPSANNLLPTQPNYCVSGPAAIFSWQFTDPDGDPRFAYQVQVDNNSGFTSPEVDSCKVISSISSSYAIGVCGSCCVNPPCSCSIAYNNTYYWRLKVWDSKDLASTDWIYPPSPPGPPTPQPGTPFETPDHAYPVAENFTWIPLKFSAKETVTFSPPVQPASVVPTWSWNIPDAAYVGGTNSASSTPQVQFNSAGAHAVSLTVTDAPPHSSYSCPSSAPINVQMPLPEWIEIPPF